MATIILDGEKKRERALYVIGELSLDRPWKVTIEPYEPRRSDEANRRLWALHNIAAAHTGHSADEMHEFMKARFLPKRKVVLFGEECEVPIGSSKLTVKAFRDFMERVEAFYISELGIVLGDHG